MHAIDTSGRAVLFAGGTVVISLLGLFLIGVSFIRGLAVGASLAVLFVMAAAVTLLPAVLGFVGHTIDKFALPSAKQPSAPSSSSFWARWSRTMQAPARGRPRSAASLILARARGAVLLAAARRRRRGQRPDQAHDPARRTTCSREGFGPGFNGPLLVAGDVTRRRSTPPR